MTNGPNVTTTTLGLKVSSFIGAAERWILQRLSFFHLPMPVAKKYDGDTIISINLSHMIVAATSFPLLSRAKKISQSSTPELPQIRLLQEFTCHCHSVIDYKECGWTGKNAISCCYL